MEWIEFDLDVNFFCGRVTTVKQWVDEVIAVYQWETGDCTIPLNARRALLDRPDGTPLFGHLSYCKGQTLEEWAKEQGMELPLELK